MAMMNKMEYRTIGSALAGGYRAAVYCRLSKDDDLQGESASIANQELICKGWFLPPNTYDCGSFVVNRKAVVGKEQKKPYNRYKFNTERSFCL